MKLRTITRDLLLIIGISAGGLLTSSSVFAKTRYLSDVPQNSFLMTNRTIHTTNDYFKDVKITIPKGTIFQIGGFSKGTKTGASLPQHQPERLKVVNPKAGHSLKA